MICPVSGAGHGDLLLKVFSGRGEKLWSTFALAGLLGFQSLYASEVVTPIQLNSGQMIQVRVRTPLSGCENKCPAFMIFGGFETASDVLDLIEADVPYIVASFDYPYKGSRKYSFPQTFREAPNLKKAIPDTLEGILRLFEILKKNEHVQSNQIGMIGASFGSPFAIEAAAKLPELKNLVVVHGFGDMRSVLKYRLLQIFSPNLPFRNQLAGLLSYFIHLYLDLPDVEKSASQLKQGQNVLVIESEMDHFIPRQSNETLRAALNQSHASVTVLQTPGSHVMPGERKLIQEIFNKIIDWLNQRKS